MPGKRNAPALAEREGVECLLAGDIDVYIIPTRIRQRTLFGPPGPILARHFFRFEPGFGEVRHG